MSGIIARHTVAAYSTTSLTNSADTPIITTRLPVKEIEKRGMAEEVVASIQEVLGRVDLFNGLDQQELERVADVCHQRSCRQGELVFGQDSAGDELYVVKSGKVVLQIKGRGHQPATVVHMVEEGQVFGEVALIDGESRAAGATAVSDCDMVILPREDLCRVLEADDHIGYVVMRNLAAILASRLRKANLQLMASESWK